MATVLLVWLLISGVATLAAWPTVRRRGWVGWAVANALFFFIAYNVAMPRYMDIRVDWLLTVPLMMVILVLGIVHLLRRRAEASGQSPSVTRVTAQRRDQDNTKD
jgi:peptidoglycan/LPS O-acetylase OafA/YrhL